MLECCSSRVRKWFSFGGRDALAVAPDDYAERYADAEPQPFLEDGADLSERFARMLADPGAVQRVVDRITHVHEHVPLPPAFAPEDRDRLLPDVLVVTLTRPEDPVTVVKAIVPGLEAEVLSHHRVGAAAVAQLRARAPHAVFDGERVPGDGWAQADGRRVGRRALARRRGSRLPAALPRARPPRLRLRRMSLRFAYNTNGLQNHRLEDAVDFLADTGYDGVALTLDIHHLDPFAPDLRGRARALRKRLDGHGMGAVIETGARFLLDPRVKHEPTLLSADPSKRIAFLGLACEVAHELEAECVSFWAGVGSGHDQLRDGSSKVLERAEELGVECALEPEPGMLVETVDDWRDLGVPGLRLALDTGHCLVTGDREPADAIRECAADLATVSVEDMRRGEHIHRPFGEGRHGPPVGPAGAGGDRLPAPRLRRAQPRQPPRPRGRAGDDRHPARVRVCFVSRRFWPAISGMSVYAENLLRELVAAGHEVTMLSQYRGDPEGMGVYGGGPPPDVDGVTVVGMEAHGEQDGGDFEADVAALRDEILARAPFDVIHAQYGYPTGLAALRAARALGVPCVVSIQGGDGHWVGSCCGTHERAMRAVLDGADALLIGSRSFARGGARAAPHAARALHHRPGGRGPDALHQQSRPRARLPRPRRPSERRARLSARRAARRAADRLRHRPRPAAGEGPRGGARPRRAVARPGPLRRGAGRVRARPRLRVAHLRRGVLQHDPRGDGVRPRLRVLPRRRRRRLPARRGERAAGRAGGHRGAACGAAPDPRRRVRCASGWPLRALEEARTIYGWPTVAQQIMAAYDRPGRHRTRPRRGPGRPRLPLPRRAAPAVRALFVSPHLDDVAFSCGGTFAALAAAGHECVLLTVFTQSVPDPTGFALACQLDKGLPPDVDYMALRRAEDHQAARRLGAAEVIHLDLPEAPHRGYDVGRSSCSPASTTTTRSRFADPGRRPRSSSPRRSAITSTTTRSSAPSATARPTATPTSPTRCVSTIRPAAPGRVAPDIDAKLDACAAYASQLGFQFGGEEGMRAALAPAPERFL